MKCKIYKLYLNRSFFFATGLWALINNAGVNFLGDIDFCTMDMYHKIMNVNLFGMVQTTKAFLPHLRKSKGTVLYKSNLLSDL